MIFIEHGAHIMHDMPHVQARAAGGGSVQNHNGQNHSHSHSQGQNHAHDRSGHRVATHAAGASVSEHLLAISAKECSIGNADRGVAAADQSGGKPGEATTVGCREQHVHACATASGDQPSSQLKDPRQQEQQQREQQQQEQQEQQQQQQEQQQEQQREQLEKLQQDEQPKPQQQQRSALAKRAPAAAIAAAGPFIRRSAGATLQPTTAEVAGIALARPLASSSVPVHSHIAMTCCHKGDGAIAIAAKNESCTTASAASDTAEAARAAAAAAADLAGGGGAGNDTLAAVLSRAALLRSPSDHCHDCVSRASAPSWASALELSSEAKSTLRQRIVAYLFELGCIFHSFIIGMSLGANRTSISQVRALLIALSFHQALEGFSLASVINGAGFSIYRAALMVVTYSVTCPLGVTIGIVIAASYDPDSTQGRAAQGCLNGVSGGMLLYISLVQLVSEDMGKYLIGPLTAADANGGIGAAADATTTHGSGPPCGHSHGGGGSGRGIGCRIRAPSFLFFCLGAASMCLLAVWA
ncbi:hypothetical protein Vretifemale_14317 [Volvox reticuliferus]|nr:hypothetical protein Vretifemale_14317 [Volvox reticuliferus]